MRLLGSNITKKTTSALIQFDRAVNFGLKCLVLGTGDLLSKEIQHKMTTLGLSIDVGMRHLAFYVEEFDSGKIMSLCPNRCMYEKDGTCTRSFSQILNRIELNGTCIFFDLFDSGSNINKSFLNISEYIHTHRYVFDILNFILIEDQMKVNTNARRICQHIYSYFTFIYGNWKPIILFPSSMKTRLLGCPRKERGTSRAKRYKMIKEWSVNHAQKILENRNDIDYLNLYSDLRKKDDVSDCICQMQAFKVNVYYMKS